jgi:hypothetical protein
MTAFVPTVPAEFVGLARQFIRDARVQGAEKAKQLNRLLDPAFERLVRHPDRAMRDGQLRALAKAWEALASPFRVAFETGIDRRGRKGFITEVTACPASLEFVDEWNEQALSLLVFRFEAPATKLFAKPGDRRSHAMWMMATIGLHALARRYQRGGDRSHAAIVRDLSALTNAAHRDYATGKPFRIEAGRGAWSGLVDGVTLTDHEESSTIQFVVRTFLSSDP